MNNIISANAVHEGNLQNKQKGFSGLVIVLILAIVVLVLAGFYVIKSDKALSFTPNSTSVVPASENSEFEKLPAAENAPAEVDDAVVKELDSLINSVEVDAETDTLEDLDL